MTKNVPVLSLFLSDFEETARIAERANQAADATTRGLLKWLLPISFIQPKTLRTTRNTYNQQIKALTSTVFGLLFKNDAMVINGVRRSQLEKTIEDERMKKINRAYSLFDSLSFEDLLPFFQDIKLKSIEYVLQKWAEKLPTEETQLPRYVILSKPEPKVFRKEYRAAEDDDKETKNE